MLENIFNKPPAQSDLIVWVHLASAAFAMQHQLSTLILPATISACRQPGSGLS